MYEKKNHFNFGGKFVVVSYYNCISVGIRKSKKFMVSRTQVCSHSINRPGHQWLVREYTCGFRVGIITIWCWNRFCSFHLINVCFNVFFKSAKDSTNVFLVYGWNCLTMVSDWGLLQLHKLLRSLKYRVSHIETWDSKWLRGKGINIFGIMVPSGSSWAELICP